MDRTIEVKVNGSHLTKDNKAAGVQHECNAKSLRITFDEGWDGFAKTVTFWDAKGQNATKRILTADRLEDITKSTRIYRCPIPGEAMTAAGWCTLVIDGWLDGKRQRSLSDKLEVKPAPYKEDAGEPTDPTPSQAEQLQVQIDTMLGNMQAEAVRAVNAAGDAAAYAGDADEAAKNASESEKNAFSHANIASTSAENARKDAQIAEESARQVQQWADRARAEVISVAEPMASGIQNVILTDRMTGAKYALLVEDGTLAILQVADTMDATDMCLIDTVTGIGYEVVVDDGRIAIKEV